MNTFISMLRGINVSGQKKIQMEDLKSLYREIGFEDVVSYIQSGNVVFSSKKYSDVKLKSLIESAIVSRFGFLVPVEIRSYADLSNIVKKFPFDRAKADAQGNKYHVTFLATAPSNAAVSDIQQFVADDEKFIVTGREIYFHCPGAYGKTKLSNNFIEKKFATIATSRNWKTVLKLIELAQ